MNNQIDLAGENQPASFGAARFWEELQNPVGRALMAVDLMVGPSPSRAMSNLAAHLRLLIATATPEMAKVAPGRPHWDADLQFIIERAKQDELPWAIYAGVPQTIVMHLQSNGLATEVDTSGWRPVRPELVSADKGHFRLIGTFIEMLFDYNLDPLETPKPSTESSYNGR